MLPSYDLFMDILPVPKPVTSVMFCNLSFKAWYRSLNRVHKLYILLFLKLQFGHKKRRPVVVTRRGGRFIPTVTRAATVFLGPLKIKIAR